MAQFHVSMCNSLFWRYTNHILKLVIHLAWNELLLQFNFHGIISSCFEPHLTVYVELEEKTLMEHLEKLVQDETWEIEGSQTNRLSSSMQVIRIILYSAVQLFAYETYKKLFKGKDGELSVIG